MVTGGWLTWRTQSDSLTSTPLNCPRPEYSGIYCDLALFGTAVLWHANNLSQTVLFSSLTIYKSLCLRPYLTRSVSIIVIIIIDNTHLHYVILTFYISRFDEFFFKPATRGSALNMTHSNSRYVTVHPTHLSTWFAFATWNNRSPVQFDFDGETCFDFISFYFIAIRAHFSFLRLLSSTTPKKPSKHWQTGSIFPVCLLVYSHDFDCPGHISRTVRIRIRTAERLNKKIKSRFILLYSILIQFRSRIDSSAEADTSRLAHQVWKEKNIGEVRLKRTAKYGIKSKIGYFLSISMPTSMNVLFSPPLLLLHSHLSR